MSQLFTYSEFDREFWEAELEDFVPPVVFDAHVHLWTERGQGHLPPAASALRTEIDFPDLQAWSGKLFPGRECHFLALGTPNPGLDWVGHNRWLARQVAADPESMAGMIVTPASTQEELDKGFAEGLFQAVKPYRLFAPDPKFARITEFLPEPLLEVVDAHGKAVMLHLSQPTGADAFENLEDLRRLTRTYPKVKWILAHCARAFNSLFLEKAIHRLKHLPNLWYDTSAVNDLYSHYLLLKHEDRGRILFGSDNVAAGCARGKYVTYGRAWQFFPGSEKLEHCDARATLVVYEQLLQQKRVADMLEFSAHDIDRLFQANAASLRKALKEQGE